MAHKSLFLRRRQWLSAGGEEGFMSLYGGGVKARGLSAGWPQAK
jgi:hypothetical protein